MVRMSVKRFLLAILVVAPIVVVVTSFQASAPPRIRSTELRFRQTQHDISRSVQLSAISTKDNDTQDGDGGTFWPWQKQKKPSNRRDVLQSTVTAGSIVGASLGSPTDGRAVGQSTLLAELPMIRLKLPSNGLGRDYIATQLCLSKDTKPVEVMIDTGLTLEMITPHLRDTLGLKSLRANLQSLTAGGVSSGGSEMVNIDGASFCSSSSENDESNSAATASSMPLPTLHAVVSDFPQEHIDPKHDPIEGMIGQELLSLYDVDFDFTAQRIRLFQPGTALSHSMVNANKFVEIPAVVINDTGFLAIRIRTSKSQQPVIGLVDCGSSFSVVNWKAAEIMQLPPRQDPSYQRGPQIAAMGVDGRPIILPTLQQSLSYVGEAIKESGKLVGFATPPTEWKGWDPILLAVGDLPVFPDLLGDGVRQYTGPAALIGLDILSQRRMIIESAGTNANKTRQRRIFVSTA